MIDWIMSQILQINLPTVFASIGGYWLTREFFDLLKHRNLQKQQTDMLKQLQLQKAAIDRDLELKKAEYQREIQAHYLNTQLKTTSLYKSLPDLHQAFKKAEGSVYQLFYHTNVSQSETYRVWCSLTQKLGEHSLFLDNHLKDACVDAKDRLMDCIRSHASLNEEAKETLISVVHAKVDHVTHLMKACLLKEELEFNLTYSNCDVSQKESALV